MLTDFSDEARCARLVNEADSRRALYLYIEIALATSGLRLCGAATAFREVKAVFGQFFYCFALTVHDAIVFGESERRVLAEKFRLAPASLLPTKIKTRLLKMLRGRRGRRHLRNAISTRHSLLRIGLNHLQGSLLRVYGNPDVFLFGNSRSGAF